MRLLFAFDGDKSKLTFVERAVFYAGGEARPAGSCRTRLLKYVWANTIPVGTVIANPHTRRVRMWSWPSGAAGVGKWQTLTRNVLDDFRRAFGEEPGMLTGVGVMTDTDNTGATVEAWYGDIRFRPADR